MQISPVAYTREVRDSGGIPKQIFIPFLSLSFTPLPPNASGLQKVINLAHFSFIIFTVCSMFFQILIHIIQNSTSSDFITEHVSTQVAFLQSISRVTMYRVNRKTFFRLLMDMNNMVRNGSPVLKRHLQGYRSIGHIIYLAYTSTVLFMAMDFCLMPLFDIDRDLPIAAWYPFDYKDSIFLYGVAYSHQISVIIMTWLCSGIDVMFGIMVFGCCARYKVMQDILRGLKKPDSHQLRNKPEIKAGKKSVTEFDKKIATLVDLHCEVLDSIKDINDLYTCILFALFLTSAIMICCAGFQMTNGSNQSINAQFIFSAIVCCVLFELLFYFVPGDLLVEEATAVGTAAYESDWESMSPEYRNCIFSIMLQSTNEPKIKIARVTPLIIENYMSFLVTTASYFTSLRAVAGID